MSEEWEPEMEVSNGSRSRWVRERVEAGRKQLTALDPKNDGNNKADGNLKKTVLEAIPEKKNTKPPEEVIQEVLKPIEDSVSELLIELNDQGEIVYDPQEKGYRQR